MELSDLDFNKTYSYADYLKWKFEESVEIIKGKIFKMSPAPSLQHQRVSGRLFVKLSNFIQSSCEVFTAPFDVRLSTKNNKDEEIYTVVQPDLCVICDSKKLDERGCKGAPDMIIEILSPGNSKKEMNNKFDIYQESGVKEYWLVHPMDKCVFVYLLNDEGEFIAHKPFIDGQILSPNLFPGLEIELSEIFKEN